MKDTNKPNTSAKTASSLEKHLKSGSRQGTIAAGMTALIVGITIIVNLMIAQLPSNVLQFDISNQDIYTISDTSIEFAAKLDKDIELILLETNGTVDQRISKFVYNYAALSDHISVTEIDAVLYPSYLTTYECEIDSLVVYCPETGRHSDIQFIGYSDDFALIYYDINWQDYSSYESRFDAEGQITSAIDQVTGDYSETIYITTGHEEADLSAALTQLILKSNLRFVDQPLDLLNTAGGVPEDCDLLIINNPTEDLAEIELAAIRDYLQAGGKIILVLEETGLTHFNALLQEYGLEMLDGHVGDQERYYSSYYQYYGYFCFAPQLSSQSSITAGVDSGALTIYASGMQETAPARSAITVEPFMTTSESGIKYMDDNTSETGSYIIGAVATEETGGGTARLTVFSSANLISESITSSITSASNLTIFMNAVTENFDAISNITIPAKNLQVTYNTVSNYGFWSILYIAVIPVTTVICGLVVWTRRRKK